MELTSERRRTRLELEANIDRQKVFLAEQGKQPARSSDVLPRPERPYKTVTGASSTLFRKRFGFVVAPEEEVAARLLQTIPGPATDSRRRAS